MNATRQVRTVFIVLALTSVGVSVSLQTLRPFVSYAPSLSTLREMMKKRPAGNRTTSLSAFGNPQLSTDLLQRVALTYKNESIEPSPHEEEELLRLKAIYGDAQSRTLTGLNASEERTKLEVTRAGIVHFATPAFLDDLSPMYSFIALASTVGSEANDGLLQSREIFNLHTPARLVVLSDSRVRSDAAANGSGAIGLAWPWFVAGTPSTVFSRWQVRSPSTTQLMADFHSRLRTRPPARKPEALRQSALAIRRSTAYQHPYYWAAFSLVGEPR